MNKFTLTILIAFGFFFNAYSGSDIEVLAPLERISVQHEHVSIVGRTKAEIVEVFLNDKKISDVIVEKHLFHTRIKYGFGLNEVKLRPIFSGKEESQSGFTTIEIMYAPQIEKKYKRLYPDYKFHTEDSNPICLNCHDCECSDLTKINDSEICTECHPLVREGFKKHNKTENQSCIICHELGAKLNVSLSAKGSTDNPCYKCHDDKIKTFDQEYVHGPVAGGSCVICHAPHGSQYDNSLKSPEAVLCVSCHEDIEAQMNVDVVHKPFKNGNCVSCHDPHSTNNAWVLKKSSEIVCLQCHLEQGTLKIHQHPYNVKPKRKLAADLILTQMGTLECLSCHDPHSSNQVHMLKTDSEFTCLGCHLDML